MGLADRPRACSVLRMHSVMSSLCDEITVTKSLCDEISGNRHYTYHVYGANSHQYFLTKKLSRAIVSTSIENFISGTVCNTSIYLLTEKG